MDLREYPEDHEEVLRTIVAGLMRGYFTSLPGRVTVDSPDGHTVTAQPTIKRAITDPATGKISFEDHPVHPDVPIQFASGGGVTLTFAITKGLEGILTYHDRNQDVWHQQGGTQQPADDRLHHQGDAVFIPGLRSDPNKLQQVSSTSSQIRSDDGHHTIDHDPQAGTTVKSVDPSTPAASPSFNPFRQATKFVEHAAKAVQGVIGRAVDGGTEHSHGVDHGIGAWMKAMGATGLVQALAHPDLGGLLSAADGKHTVQAHPEQGVMVASQKAVSISAPPGMLALAGLVGGSIGGAALAPGAASQNVGAVGGDLAGTLPNPTVVSIAHLAGQDKTLVQAASESAAAAAGVAVGSPYLNTSVKSGVGLLAIRLT